MIDEEFVKNLFSDFTDEEMQIFEYATNPLLRNRAAINISLLRDDLNEMGPKLLEERKIREAMNVADAMAWLEIFETLLKNLNKLDKIIFPN